MSLSLTPEQRFRQWTLLGMLLGLASIIYFFISDISHPFTPHSRLIYKVITVSPEVSGKVINVAVKNDQKVKKGDVLFYIDPTDYILNLNSAKLKLEQAYEDNKTLDSKIKEAENELNSAEISLKLARDDEDRYLKLNAIAISKQQVDKAIGDREKNEANVKQLKYNILSLVTQRGLYGDENLQIRKAMNDLAVSRTELNKTTVTSPISGTISNMNLNTGHVVSPGVPLLSIVSDSGVIYADFREKSLSKLKEKIRAYVVFDAIPGKVFNGKVIGKDSGVINGQLYADGNLASTEQSDRWIRDAQRIRIYINLDDPLPDGLTSGARATVQIYSSNDTLTKYLSRLQINVISWLHYIY